MKIGLLSDTHGDVFATQRAVDMLRKHSVDLTIHCGDIGPEVVPLLAGIRTHFVLGNMDDAKQMQRVIRDPAHTLHTGIGTLDIDGRRIAFMHGNDVKLLRHTVASGHWDMVCHGHTHRYSKEYDGHTLVLNPGALSRTSHPSLAVVELPSMEIEEMYL
jgi:uncharacterized protein